MGFKTVIGSKGVETTQVSGDNQFLVEVSEATAEKKTVTNVSESGDFTITNEPVVVANPNAATSSITLPAIGTSNVGTEYLIIVDDTTSDVLISGSNPVDGGAWTILLSGTEFDHRRLIAISGSGGFNWVTV